ncbi:MAG: hypothetical protein ACXWV0_03655 [Flavisolibacter sp.]
MNKYLPFALVYFFVNALGLPFGLTYMTLFAPLFYLWIALERKTEVLLPFLLVIFPFAFVHLVFIGADIKAYFISLLNITAVYISAQAVFTFIKRCSGIASIFRWLLVINFLLCLAALFFYNSEEFEIFWISQTLTEGVQDFKRLRLFTYEASHYALLFVPLFLYYFLRFLLGQNRVSAWLLLPMITLPFLLSFSLGVMAVLGMALLLGFMLQLSSFLRQRRVVNMLVLGSLLAIPLVLMIYYLFPGNSLWLRLENILSWEDSSGRGRTSEAFYLAGKIMEQKSEWMGIGPGQVRVVGEELIRDYYLYSPEFTTIAIPNAAAETLAVFGYAGLFIRLFVELFLFFYTRVWTSHYRLVLFLFIFVYQFTGSYITNLAEYVIWILAFTEVFPQLSIQRNLSRITSIDSIKPAVWQVS